MNQSGFFRLCFKCNKEGVNHGKCSKCQVAHYCTRVCQINDWVDHKYICNLTKKSHSVLTDDLNYIITNIKLLCLIKALTYHFFFKDEDQFLMCIINKVIEDNQNYYQLSFIINHIDDLKTKNLDREFKILWFIFMNKENNTSEGGFRFNINECKKYYDSLNELINFDEVHTLKDIPIEGSEVSFDDSIKTHCKVLMTDDINKCLFFYNNHEILL